MKFRSGDFDLNNAFWLGRALEVDYDEIEGMIKSNQRYTTGEIVESAFQDARIRKLA